MYPLTSALAAALDSPDVTLGRFVSVGAEQSDTTLTWERFSDQQPDVSLGGVTYPGGETLGSVVLPIRRTLNLGGGRTGRVTVEDKQRTVFSAVSALAPAATRVRVDVALYSGGEWRGPLRLFAGHVDGVRWVASAGQTEIATIGRVGIARTNIVVATDADQKKREATDGALDQIGRQVYLDWTGP